MLSKLLIATNHKEFMNFEYKLPKNYTIKEMLKLTIQHGFDKIYSRHMITNNEILIAKLKQGFKLTTFELSETFGTMAHLTFYKSKIKNEILDFRSGHKRPYSKMKKIFKL